MPIKFAIEGANELAMGVWVADVPPEQLKSIAGPRTALGDVSILFLPALRAPAVDSQQLEFEPAGAQLLNLGKASSTIIIYGDALHAPEDAELTRQAVGPRVQHDDAAFLEEIKQLPRDLAEAGRRILETIRAEFPGGFLQRTDSGRFVNRPTNFWAVKVQPRDQSYSIIVRGRPHEYRAAGGDLEIKEDQRGYSRFKLERSTDLGSALAILRRAGRR